MDLFIKRIIMDYNLSHVIYKILPFLRSESILRRSYLHVYKNLERKNFYVVLYSSTS